MQLTDAELVFIDEVGRHYQRHYAVPPMVGRVVGYLLVCEPSDQTAAEIAEALQASRSGVGTAVSMLETWGGIRRTRVRGERADRVGFSPAATQAPQAPAEHGPLAAPAPPRPGRSQGRPPGRRAPP